MILIDPQNLAHIFSYNPSLIFKFIFETIVYEHSIYIISTPASLSSSYHVLPLHLELVTSSLLLFHTHIWIYNILTPLEVAHMCMCLRLITWYWITYQGARFYREN